MIPQKLSFVDVETTGLSSSYGKIVEIGIVRVENNKVVGEYSTLINPQIRVDPFILSLTGINPKDLENAPTFYEASKQIRKLLEDSLFIAHNVLFDYSFIKKEFERLEQSFTSKYCCSVKLSKKLYPHFKRHNLDAIIERLELKCQNRHRAFDDAKAIFDFYSLSLKKLGEKKLSLAFDSVLKRPSLPLNISEDVLDSLPDCPGVYIFYDKDNVPLYIGKSKNLRTRVMSHFSSSKKAGIDMKIAQSINRIETTETAGELGALLLEATLIKKLQPLYNRKLRYAFKLLALKKITTDQKYYTVTEVDLQDMQINELNQVLGVFKSKKQLKNFLIAIAKQYNLCPKLLGLEKGSKNCFNYHLDLCLGACEEKEKYLKYNLRFDEAFYHTKIKDWPFKGPIAIKEKGGKEDIFVLDKWCVLGKLKDESDSLEELGKEYLFDTDTYQILNRYLNHEKDLKIYPLKRI